MSCGARHRKQAALLLVARSPIEGMSFSDKNDHQCQIRRTPWTLEGRNYQTARRSRNNVQQALRMPPPMVPRPTKIPHRCTRKWMAAIADEMPEKWRRQFLQIMGQKLHTVHLSRHQYRSVSLCGDSASRGVGWNAQNRYCIEVSFTMFLLK